MLRYLLMTGLLPLAAASAAAAPTHTLVTRVTRGAETYAHTEKLAEGAQTNYVGQSNGRRVIVNTILSKAPAGLSVSYQIEVSRQDGGGGLQAQGSVALAPGDHVLALDCGKWRIDFALDSTSPKSAPSAWSPAGRNYRLTTDGARRRCRLLIELESQANIVDSGAVGSGSSYILNEVLKKPVKGIFGLSYQLEDAPRQLQGDAGLALGKKAAGTGGVEFLLEGPTPAAEPPPVAAPAAPAPSQGGGAVPLLR